MELKKIELDWDAADSITSECLKQHILMLEERQEKQNAHPDDLKEDRDVLIPAMKVVSEYFGG